MRRTAVFSILALSIVASAANAQSPQAAGLTRDQFIERAKQRAAQNAARHFDQIDANHDGIVDRQERRNWRQQRRQNAMPSSPTQ